MGLYAFRVAHIWLAEVERAESGLQADLPTPLQYAYTLLRSSTL